MTYRSSPSFARPSPACGHHVSAAGHSRAAGPAGMVTPGQYRAGGADFVVIGGCRPAADLQIADQRFGFAIGMAER